MQNQLRGCAEFTVSGKRFDVVFNWNSAVEFEEQVGKPISAAIDEILAGRLVAKDLRALLWAGLRERHPEIGIREVGTLLDVMGKREAQRVIGDGVRYFFPELAQPAEGRDADPLIPPPST